MGLALRPLGADLNLLAHVTRVIGWTTRPDRVCKAGVGGFGPIFSLWVRFTRNPGLVLLSRSRAGATRADVPAGSVAPEWTFVDPASGG